VGACRLLPIHRSTAVSWARLLLTGGRRMGAAEGGAAVHGWALARVGERLAEAALVDREALVASLRRPGGCA